MDLMIDIGNTHTVAGIFNNNKLYKSWRVASELSRTEDEYWVILHTFLSNEQIDPGKIRGICISSVVPDLNLLYKRMINKYLHIDPLFIHSGLDIGLKIEYEYPAAVGTDRLCNAIAGKMKYGMPLIIIDFGTATTIDCVNQKGDYIGGIICPGIETTSFILHKKAAKLPKIDLKFPPNIIGRNTEESIQSGIMFGTVAMIDGLLKQIKKEFKKVPKVIATGGLANLVSSYAKSIDHVEEYLNLEGIYIIYNRNK